MELTHFNRLLRRQILKHYGQNTPLPPEVLPLLNAISHSYDHYESDRELIERAMDLSSSELMEMNRQLQEDAGKREKSEELFRLVAESSSDLIYEFFPDTASVTWYGTIDPSLPYTIEDFPIDATAWIEQLHPDDRDWVTNAFHRSLQDDVPFNHEYRIIINGTVYYWQDRSSIVRNNAQQVVRWVGSIKDVTSQRKYEADLQKSEAIVTALVENTEDSIWSVDHELRLVAFNLAYAQRINVLFGNDPKPGQTVEQRTGSKSQEQWTEWYDRALKGERFTTELLVRMGDKDVYHDFSFNPVITHDGVKGVVVFSRDITDSKLLNKQLLDAKNAAEEMSRLKSSFLANMSHEIRTPMTSILGFAEHLQDNIADEELRYCAEIIGRGAKRLLDTINGILDLARIESGKMSLSLEPTFINDACEKICDLLSPLAEEKQLRLYVEHEQKVIAIADPTSLNQVLINIVGNAIKFTRSGEVKITVGAAGDHAIVEIADTGIGMSEEFASHAFEQFTQESTGYGRSHEGNGLGLCIAKELTTLMNGCITLDSQKNIGSTFRVFLPLAD